LVKLLEIQSEVMGKLCILIAFLIGCTSAYSELLSRYKSPWQIIKIPAGLAYLFINGIASVIAYILVHKFKIADGNIVFQTVIAGTSALIILRSSIANIKVGEKTTDVGIAAILQVFLNAADRSFDQIRSDNELSKVSKLMENVDFEKAKLALPITCFNSMRNVPQDEQKQVSSDVEKLSKENLDNNTKAINLGILLAKSTELKLLEKAVSTLNASIINDGNKRTSSQQLEEILNKLK